MSDLTDTRVLYQDLNGYPRPHTDRGEHVTKYGLTRESLAGLPAHALADAYPMMSATELKSLAEDIRIQGNHDAIVLYIRPDGFLGLLEGRNRRLAALKYGDDPDLTYGDKENTRPPTGFEQLRCVMYEGDDPDSFIFSKNLKRRHLNPSSQALFAAAYVEHLESRRKKGLAVPKGRPRDIAASQSGVSPRTVQSAMAVRKTGSEKLLAQTMAGTVAVSTAADIASLPKQEQDLVVARGDEEILEAAKKIRKKKREKRTKERLDLAAFKAEAPKLDSFPCRYLIVCPDFPWEQSDMGSSVDSGASSHVYPKMSDQEIMDYPIPELSADDSLLLLWVPVTVLADGLGHRCVKNWGFEVRTIMGWDKNPGGGLKCAGGGFWTTQDLEFLMVCVRGDFPCIPTDFRLPSPLRLKKEKRHSAKPDFFYDRIREAYPGVECLELFGRKPRKGWTVAGNEVGILFPDTGESEAQTDTATEDNQLPGQERLPLIESIFSKECLELMEGVGGCFNSSRLKEMHEHGLENHPQGGVRFPPGSEKVPEGCGEISSRMCSWCLGLLNESFKGSAHSGCQAERERGQAPTPLPHLAEAAQGVTDPNLIERRDSIGLVPESTGGVLFTPGFPKSGSGRRCAWCLGLLTHTAIGSTHKKCQKPYFDHKKGEGI